MNTNEQVKHTPTPWKFEEGINSSEVFIDSPKYKNIASYVSPEDAEFIVRACNAHDDLVNALNVVFHSQARESMSVREFDQVKEALAKAEGK